MRDVAVRRFVRRLGFDIERRRPVLTDLLAARRVDVVLDVGANEGQFGRRLRAWGYRGRIVSFEPLSSAYEVLARHARRDGNWETHRVALGASDGRATLNVSEHTVFSSLRETGPDLQSTFPAAAPRRTEDVVVRSLATLARELGSLGDRPFLKVDVQGFEREVLTGAQPLIGAMAGVQVELTLRRLYIGESTMAEITAELERHDMVMSLLEPVAYDAGTGALLALDAVFLPRAA